VSLTCTVKFNSATGCKLADNALVKYKEAALIRITFLFVTFVIIEKSLIWYLINHQIIKSSNQHAIIL